jgi:nicotinamidase-related amidase
VTLEGPDGPHSPPRAAPDKNGPMAGRALIVVDMLQTYDFEDADRLRANVSGTLPVIRDLIDRARSAGTPVIYVNDSFGNWRGDRRAFLEEISSGPHADLVEPVMPGEEALLIFKARHSIFYETPLGYLLRSQGVESIVLTGQVTEQCVLYSALDAHIRHIPVVVPRDAVAHIHADLADAALKMMQRNMEAEVTDAAAVRFE